MLSVKLPNHKILHAENCIRVCGTDVVCREYVMNWLVAHATKNAVSLKYCTKLTDEKAAYGVALYSGDSATNVDGDSDAIQMKRLGYILGTEEIGTELTTSRDVVIEVLPVDNDVRAVCVRFVYPAFGHVYVLYK